jgi:O-antigen/teichoic acid export membrane protein
MRSRLLQEPPIISGMNEHTAGIEREHRLAFINALKLTLSLMATLLIAVAIRFWLPRVLGPAVFGKLHFAESLALGLFLFTTLGAEVYIRKEIATRPSHASDFFGGLLVVRAICSILVFGLMALTLALMSKDGLEWRLALLFGIGQVAFVFEQTLAALLHASGTVTALSLLNAGSKVVWGIGIFGGVLLGGGPELVAAAFAVTEWGKATALFFIVRRVTSLELRIRWRMSLHMLAASFPFFLNYLAHRIYERIDVQMLSVMTNDQEVGWYGAAVNLATAGVIFMPVVGAILLPMGSRLAARSHEALNEMMRNAVRLVLSVGSLCALLVALHADDLVSVSFGDAFAPSTKSLAILAPMFPLTYLAVLTSMHLVQLGRIWTVAKISLVGLLLNPLLNLLAIPWAMSAFGVGGGGIGASLTTVGTEIFASTMMLLALGRAGVDRRLAITVTKVLLLCLVVYGVHVGTSPLGLVRVPLESALWIGLGWPLGIVPVREIVRTAKDLVLRRTGRG